MGIPAVLDVQAGRVDAGRAPRDNEVGNAAVAVVVIDHELSRCLSRGRKEQCDRASGAALGVVNDDVPNGRRKARARVVSGAVARVAGRHGYDAAMPHRVKREPASQLPAVGAMAMRVMADVLPHRHSVASESSWLSATEPRTREDTFFWNAVPV